MSTEYKALSANNVADLSTAINAETAQGFYVFGSISCSTDSDTLNNVSELYSILMQRSKE